jgi:hypothetical protein
MVMDQYFSDVWYSVLYEEVVTLLLEQAAA